jgi:sulfur carrier protein
MGAQPVKVILRHPERREVAVEGRRRVGDLLRDLGLQPEAYLVIRDNRLLTRDAQLEESDTVEVRPVISGGASRPARGEG